MRANAPAFTGSYMIGVLAALFLALHSSSSFAVPPLKSSNAGIKWHPGHYMLVYLNAPQSQLSALRDEPLIKGAQIRYMWAHLEPMKDVYDFSKIEADLRYLESLPAPKRLVIQIMDRRFSKSLPNGIVPSYLLNDPQYGGGIAETRKGYIARIWDPAVMDRLIALYVALAARFDAEPYFEGITTEESTPGFARQSPPDFSNIKLATQINRLTTAARKSWNNTNIFLYTNWLSGALEEVIEHSYQERCGVGGPDVLPRSPPAGSQIIAGANGRAGYKGKLPIAFAVQAPALCGKEGCNLPQDLFNYAVDTLGANYIFWLKFGTEKDTATAKYSWREGIIPVIRLNAGRINTRCPNNYHDRCVTD